ncbi:hypothetical protein CHUAL_001267 [Chamberlinius hualienensis]
MYTSNMIGNETDSQNMSEMISVEKIFKSNRLMFNLLHLSGLNADFFHVRRLFCIRWILRFLVLSTGMVNFVYMVQTLHNGLGSDDLWILCYCDHVFIFVFLFVTSMRELEIRQFTIDVIKMAISTTEKELVIREITKMFHIFAFISLSMLIPLPFIAYLQVDVSIKCEEWFQLRFFEWKTSPLIRGIITGIIEIFYGYSCFIFAIYTGFIIVLIYMLSIAYENVNSAFARLERVTVSKLENYQEQHLELSKITGKFNRIFSPAILVLVAVLFGKIIGIPGNVRACQEQYSAVSSLKFYSTFSTWWDVSSPSARSIYVLFFLFKMAHHVHQFSQKVFEQLLETSIKHPEIYEESIKDLVRHCSKIQMFSDKWSVSATTITASDIFTLDYTLIGVVLSITVTYWTLIGEVKENVSYSTMNITCLE